MTVEKLSYVIPVYNEEENIDELYEEITGVSKTLPYNYEILFVDDGSSDNSLNKIKTLLQEDKHIKYISFAQNRGQSAALYAGFTYASGDTIITMDSDLQNDAKDIPNMLKYYGDYDMVTGWRYSRKDTFSKKMGSKIGNGVRNFLTNETIHDTGCSLKIMRADMLKKIKMFKGLHRFLPTLMRLEGARVKEIKVNHRQRIHGKSKYTNLKRAQEGFYDLMSVRWMIKRYINYTIKDKNV